MIALWGIIKSLWSRVNDAMMGGAARAALPSFTSPDAAAVYLMEHALYTGDPGGGAADFYLHPKRLQAAMNAGPDAVKRLSVDCDDYATWAYQALLTVPECVPQIFTLLDAGLVGSHVVCAYRWGLLSGVIDTNGHRYLINIEPDTLCSAFTDVYASRGYRYIAASPTAYPF